MDPMFRPAEIFEGFIKFFEDLPGQSTSAPSTDPACGSLLAAGAKRFSTKTARRLKRG
jgi:hypothetical protein